MLLNYLFTIKEEIIWKLIQKSKAAFQWRSGCKMCRDAFKETNYVEQTNLKLKNELLKSNMNTSE
jgi:hypothetical protein